MSSSSFSSSLQDKEFKSEYSWIFIELTSVQNRTSLQYLKKKKYVHNLIQFTVSINVIVFLGKDFL